MKITNTAERLKEIMKRKNLKQVDVLNLASPYLEKYSVKLNKSDLSQYISGKVEPGQKKLTVLSLALDVSEAWLMGYDLPEKTESEITKLDSELISIMRSLNTQKKEELLETLKALSQNDPL